MSKTRNKSTGSIGKIKLNIERKQCGLTPRDRQSSGLHLEEHTYKEDFVVTGKCQVCGMRCLGTIFKCTKCKLIVHKKCKESFYLKCSGKEQPIDFPSPTFSRKNLQNGQHSFRKVTNPLSVQCFVCRELILSDRCKCSICNVNAHKKCVPFIKIQCKPISSPEDEKDYHWFVETSNSKKNCVVCKSSCSVLHYKCAWCKLDVDSKCISQLPSTCFLGRLSKYVLPPRLVVEKDDWYEAVYDETKEPMVFFINNKSGGHAGKSIFEHALSVFNPAQVYNVLKGYERPFNFIKNYEDNFVAVICGGDGTVGFLMNEFKRQNMKPKIFVIPLGTGNDMSISTGWGGGYDGEEIVPLLSQVYDASVQDMDRWQVCVNDEEEPIHIFNNYFSVGIDAAIAMIFDTRRKENPSMFSSRLANKIQYVMSSTPVLTAENPIKNIQIRVDGRDIELPKVEGIAIINLPTYGGGNRFWPPCSTLERIYGFHDLHYNDGEIEIVGFTSALHLGACVSGTGVSKPLKIAQGKVIEIVLDQDTPCQFDGEPYMQSKCTLRISLYEKVRFIVKNLFDVNPK